MPFKLGTPELIIILVIILLLFGATRIPQVANSLGKGIREFRKAVSGGGEEAKKEKKPVAKGKTKKA